MLNGPAVGKQPRPHVSLRLPVFTSHALASALAQRYVSGTYCRANRFDVWEIYAGSEALQGRDYEEYLPGRNQAGSSPTFRKDVCLHLQTRRVSQAKSSQHHSEPSYSPTLKMNAARFSETSVIYRTTQKVVLFETKPIGKFSKVAKVTQGNKYV